MKRKNKYFRMIALAAALAMGFYSGPAMVFAEEAVQTGEASQTAEPIETIYIDTTQDLLDFAEKCTLDTWSRGKEVVLRQDISLADAGFLPIPVFGGVFNGNGHQITGMDIGEKISPAGLFGVLEESAVVKNLNVSGNVHITDDHVGGIAGINQGMILDCSFDGSLSGKNNVGGIAGTNGSEGTIRNCRISGNIQGSGMTGGAAGNNMGTLSSCSNSSNVNIAVVDPGININELDLEPNQNLLQISVLDTVNVATDTGGIAGYSSGMVLSCVNEGTVGYPHIGYNVGGIAGRSSGYLFGCTNRGDVFGRKDIGGIAGQAEPDILLNLTADRLEQIREELNKLEEMVSQAMVHASDSSAQISSRLTDIGSGIDTASAYAKNLSGQLAEYGGSIVGEINRGGVILSDIVEQLSRNGDKLTEASAEASEGIRLLEQSARELAQSGEFGEAAAQDLQRAAEDLAAAGQLLGSGMGKIADGLGKLREAVVIEDENAVYEALEQVEDGNRELSAAMEKTGQAMGELADALETDPMVQGEVIAAIRGLGNALGETTSAVQTIMDGINKIQENITMDPEASGEGIAQIQGGLQAISQIPGQAAGAAADIRNALENMGTAQGGMKQSLEALAGAFAAFGEASENGTEIVANLSSLLSGLKDTKPIQMVYPSEAVGETADALYASMGEIKGRIEKLNAASSSSSETIAADFRGIAGQSMTVMNLMLDMVYQMENGSEDEMVSDTSEQDMDAVINGKVSSCKNAGSVCGDINIGGIAGALAIEYEFDPEDDISPSYRREYELKAILQKCVNDADVTGRRDYVGGICGRMDLGLAAGCEGYGTIISENGGYVGGISGLSTGTVRECFAKCSLQGKKYIGGIVGRGSGQDMEGHAGKILNCYSMVDVVSYEQYAGAIAGDEGGTYAGNYFVSDSLAGISRYSRAGQAEPIAYEALLAAAGLPEPFRRITVRFLDGEELVRQLSLQYGEGLEKKDFPGIPEKEGCFSRWSEEEVHNLHFDLDIEAAYLPYETALPSKEMREDGREIFFVEGQFDDKASFVASRIGLPVLEGNQDVEQELLESRMLKKSRLEECWRLEIPQDGVSSHKVRYLSPDEKTEGWSVYIYRDGIWKKADLSAAGSYLEFEADEEAHYIAIVRHVGKWVQAAALLLAFVLIVLFFCLFGKWKKTGRKGRKRKKKTRKKKRPKNRPKSRI